MRTLYEVYFVTTSGPRQSTTFVADKVSPNEQEYIFTKDSKDGSREVARFRIEHVVGYERRDVEDKGN